MFKHILRIKEGFYRLKCMCNKHDFKKMPYVIKSVSPMNYFECKYCNQVAISAQSRPLTFIHFDYFNPIVGRKRKIDSTRCVLFEKYIVLKNGYNNNIEHYVHNNDNNVGPFILQ